MAEKYDDAFLEEKWREFADVLIDYTDDYPDGVIANGWFIFDKGTERMDIWHWFDDHYSKGIHALLYPND